MKCPEHIINSQPKLTWGQRSIDRADSDVKWLDVHPIWPPQGRQWHITIWCHWGVTWLRHRDGSQHHWRSVGLFPQEFSELCPQTADQTVDVNGRIRGAVHVFCELTRSHRVLKKDWRKCCLHRPGKSLDFKARHALLCLNWLTVMPLWSLGKMDSTVYI